MKILKKGAGLLILLLSLMFSVLRCKKSSTEPPPDPVPSVSSVQPVLGIPNDPVTIKGANFANADKVSFGSTAASIVKNTGTEILVNVPANATAGVIKLSVHTPGGTSNETDFEVVKTPDHIDSLPPDISNIIPVSNFIDYPVLIYGDNLSGVIKLTFNDKAAVIYAQNQNVVTTAVPKDLPTGAVTITLTTVKGTFTKQFQVQGPPPANATPGSFSIVVPPPPDYVQTISNDWSCGLFSQNSNTDSAFFNLNSEDLDGNFGVTGYYKYSFDKAKNYNNINYVEFTDKDTGEKKAGMFSSKYNNPCILTMVLVSSLTGTISTCTFDKRSNNPDLDCEHD